MKEGGIILLTSPISDEDSRNDLNCSNLPKLLRRQRNSQQNSQRHGLAGELRRSEGPSPQCVKNWRVQFHGWTFLHGQLFESTFGVDDRVNHYLPAVISLQQFIGEFRHFFVGGEGRRYAFD